MTSRRPHVSSALVFALALAAGWSLSGGCGGRSLLTQPDDGGAAGKPTSGTAGDGGGTAGTSPTGTATGSGTGTGTGTAGVGGVSQGAGGVTGSAGAFTGSAGSTSAGAAGVTGTAGAPNTGTAGVTGAGGVTGAAGTGVACGPCPDVKCKDGFMKVVDPAVSCCPICRPINCALVDCANPLCPIGSHTEVPMGQCCPVCVKGPSESCNKAQQTYDSARESMLAKYGSSPCKVDSDCRLVFEHSNCLNNCGEALPVSTAGFFESGIRMYADACNGVCPMLPLPPCAKLNAVCSNGLCTALPGPGLGLN